MSVPLLAFWYGILAPDLRSARTAALSAQEDEYVKEADRALLGYVDDHGDRYPKLSGDMTPVLRPYLKDPKAIEAIGRFIWNDRLSGKSERAIEDPSDQWVLYSLAPGTKTYAIGFADGFEHYASSRFLALVLQRKARLPWAGQGVIVDPSRDVKQNTIRPKLRK